MTPARTRLTALLTGAISAGYSGAAAAHAFDDRYDLPVPLGYFVAGATAAVALSFVVAALVLRRPPPVAAHARVVLQVGPALPWLRHGARALSTALFVLAVAAGLFGTQNALGNVTPTLVWIIAWIGLSLLATCIGDLWNAIDPWRALFGRLDTWARRGGHTRGAALGWRYPPALGAWPGTALLLALGWFELVDPNAAEPRHIALVLLAWSAVTLGGMVCFGRETWQRNADVFALYFSTLGRFAPVAAGPDTRSVTLRLPGRGLLWPPATSAASVGFVMAMLATVLFDGLLGGPLWTAAEAALKPAAAGADTDVLLATAGLLAVWLLLWAAFRLACIGTARLAGNCTAGGVERSFALTLVPIAIGYTLAHNCSNLLVQGQRIIPLLSDPFGRQWNLFGTAAYRVEIGIMDARLTWYVAIAAIVAGHAIAIWLAHRVALREFGTPRRAMLASLPLTAVMLGYTAVSLSVIAEPLVKFG